MTHLYGITAEYGDWRLHTVLEAESFEQAIEEAKDQFLGMFSDSGQVTIREVTRLEDDPVCNTCAEKELDS
jgi:hypothetical protein